MTKKVYSFRLSKETNEKIEALRNAEFISSNITLSKAQVIELAISQLHEKALGGK
jgi:predicted DNA-binding protein